MKAAGISPRHLGLSCKSTEWEKRRENPLMIMILPCHLLPLFFSRETDWTEEEGLQRGRNMVEKPPRYAAQEYGGERR